MTREMNDPKNSDLLTLFETGSTRLIFPRVFFFLRDFREIGPEFLGKPPTYNYAVGAVCAGRARGAVLGKRFSAGV